MLKYSKYLILVFLFSSIVATGQINIRHFMSMGKNALMDNDYTSAVQYFNVIINHEPDLFEPYFLRGVAKYSLGDYQGAERDFTVSIQMHPMYSHAYHYRGVTRDLLLDYHNALQDYNRGIGLDPFNADIYISRGATRLHMKSYISAIKDFDQAVEYNANNPMAYLNRAIAKGLLKDYEGAIEDCNHAIRLDYFNTQAYLKRGVIKLETENYDGALEDFEQAIKLEPNDSYAYFNRALSKIYLADTTGAIRDLSKVLSMDPYNALTYYNRALLKAQQEDYLGAIDDFNRVLMLNPDNIYTYYNRATVKHQLEDYEGAIDDYTMAISLFPDFAGAYLNRSAAKGSINDQAGAKEDYDRAISIVNAMNTDGGIDEQLLTEYADSTYFNDIIKFEAEFSGGQAVEGDQEKPDVSIAIEPDFIVQYFKDEELYIQLKRGGHFVEKLYDYPYKNNQTLLVGITNQEILLSLDEAEKQLKIADSVIVYEPRSYKAFFYKGMINGMVKNYSSSLAAYTRAIELQPDFAMAYFNRANILLLMEESVYQEGAISQNVTINWGKAEPQTVKKTSVEINYKKVLQNLDKAILLQPKWGFAYFNRANLKVRLKDYKGAIADYASAIQHQPDLAEAYFNRGLTHIFMKNNISGCEDLGKAGELGIHDAYKAINRYCYK